MNKDDAKIQLRVLLDRYTHLKAEKETDIKSKAEEKTKTKLIRPLFERVLGWNFEEDVTGEEKISKGWVDYGFRINDVPKFFLEAKGLGEDLDNSTFFQQAYSYAYYKRCAWAVLTNFETIEIINAESEAPYNQYSHMTIKCNEFLDKFDDLWLLSQEGFEKGLLDKLAERFVRRPKRVTFDRQLLDDFTRFRDMLSKNITKLNQKKQLTEEDLDESVQRILNRLIFIRNCEDRELEEKKLWEAKNEAKVWKKVKEVFAYYDKYYDSKLFTYVNDPQKLHLCDKLDIEDGVLRDILGNLYQTKDRSVSYDFKIIPANVIGTVYEQYLSHILKKTEKRAVLSENQTHRKEQGIYYTPTYIVEYIVENSLGELLKDKKINVEQTKILDPACGSGSFLIKAFDLLNEHYIKTDADYCQTLLDLKTDILFKAKAKILQKNIFGVDLDRQAVEITQLNLLLKIAEKRHMLPLLEQNIKRGNSLVDDEKIAGDKAFKWEEEFPDIMRTGGFDVIIGNPPWVSIKGKHKSIDLSEEELDYLIKKYHSDTYMPNLYELFVWRSMSLLNENGLFSFIVPDRICANQQFTNLRKFILENFSIRKLWFKVPFPNVIADTVIFVLEKRKSKNNIVEVTEYENNSSEKIPQRVFQESSDYAFFYVRKEIFDVFQKIKSAKDVTRLDTRVGVLTTSGCGAKSTKVTDTRQNSGQIPILKGESILRYRFRKKFWFEFIDGNLSGRTRDERKLGKKFKVLLRKTGSDLVATFDDTGIYPEQSLYFVYTEEDTEREKDNLLFVLALLNSKLMNCYYRNFAVTNRDSTPQLKNMDLDKFPIKLTSEPERKPIIKLVTKMLDLNESLSQTENKMTDKRAKLEDEIKQTDQNIDEFVYEIYGLNEEEKKIIENSLK